MHPDLEQLKQEFDAIRADTGRLMTGMRDDQFNWRPAPGRWSIGECLSHLNVVDGLDVDLLARAVAGARAKGWTGSGPFRYGRVSAWLIRKLEPPVQSKTNAPKVYQPPPDQPRERVVAEFHRIHERLLEVLAAADGLDLVRVKIPTPVARWIRFSFTPRMRLIAVHDRRHLWQAWQVPTNPGFPG
jgi:hypothetical protein